MDTKIPVQNTNFTRNDEKLAEVPRVESKSEGDSHSEFTGIWQSLWRSPAESLHVNTPSIRDKRHRRTSWMKNGEMIPWSATVICATFKTSYRTAKLFVKDVLENHCVGQKIPFESMIEYHPISATERARLHEFGIKVLPGIFVGFALHG